MLKTDGQAPQPQLDQDCARGGLYRRLTTQLRIVGHSGETAIKKRQCNCKRSNCLKLYCECFANGVHCDAEKCNCVSCYNNVQHETLRRDAVEVTLERNPNAFRPKIVATSTSPLNSKNRHHRGCHCKRSNCLKKYCECFQANICCTDKCRCLECKNFEGSQAREKLLGSKAIGAAGSGQSLNDFNKRPRSMFEEGGERDEEFNDDYIRARLGLGESGILNRKKNEKSVLEEVMDADKLDDLCMVLVKAAWAEECRNLPDTIDIAGARMTKEGSGVAAGVSVNGEKIEREEANDQNQEEREKSLDATENLDEDGGLDLTATDSMVELQAQEDLGMEHRGGDHVGSLYERQESSVLQHFCSTLRRLAELASGEDKKRRPPSAFTSFLA